MLACDFELAALVLNFIEQADILDGDAGLVRERGCQFDLLFRKRPHRKPHQHDDAYWISFAQDGHTHDRAKTDHPLHVQQGIVWISQHIRNLNRLAFGHCAAQYAAPSCGERDGA